MSALSSACQYRVRVAKGNSQSLILLIRREYRKKHMKTMNNYIYALYRFKK